MEWLSIAKITGHKNLCNLIKSYDPGLEGPGLANVAAAIATGPQVAQGESFEKVDLETRKRRSEKSNADEMEVSGPLGKASNPKESTNVAPSPPPSITNDIEANFDLTFDSPSRPEMGELVNVEDDRTSNQYFEDDIKEHDDKENEATSYPKIQTATYQHPISHPRNRSDAVSSVQMSRGSKDKTRFPAGSSQTYYGPPPHQPPFTPIQVHIHLNQPQSCSYTSPQNSYPQVSSNWETVSPPHPYPGHPPHLQSQKACLPNLPQQPPQLHPGSFGAQKTVGRCVSCERKEVRSYQMRDLTSKEHGSGGSHSSWGHSKADWSRK